MGDVIEINGKRYFTLDEAKELLPVVRRITRTAYDDVKRLNSQLTFMNNRTKTKEIEDSIQAIFQDWYRKMNKLGCEAKGMWLVDFDSGEGYYCWHYPEPEIHYFHGYLDGFRGRTKIT